MTIKELILTLKKKTKKKLDEIRHVKVKRIKD